MIQFRTIGVLLLLLLLAACSGTYQAPVDDVAGGPRHLHDGRVHRVNDGETLYAIAWMYDVDYRLVAQINEITPPYTIYTGQFLSVDTRGQTLKSPPAPAPEPEPERSRPARQPRPPEVTRAPPPEPSASSPSAPASEQKPSTPKAEAPAASDDPTGPVSSWRWPARGELVGRFSDGDSGNRGLDIAADRGEPVHAAAAGQVVYAGSGLLRYGEMIIIKHNDRFLSAYAHNESLLVAEGDRVRQGQQIARMGSTGIDRVMLHFEIRDRGQPVNPLDFLPQR